MEISKEQFLNWKNDEVTKSIIDSLTEIRDRYKEGLSVGETLSDNAERDTARAVGFISGLNAIIHIEYEDEVEPYDH